MHRIDGEYWSYSFTENPGNQPSAVVEGIQGRDKVRYVARYVGEFSVLTAFTHSTFEELQEAVDSLWVAGLRTLTVGLVSPGQVAVPKRHSPDYNAIMLALAGGDRQEILDAADAVFAERAAADPDHEQFSYASGIVNGGRRGDLLFDLGSDDYEELVGMVESELLAVEGVQRRMLAYAYLPGNAWRPPESPQA